MKLSSSTVTFHGPVPTIAAIDVGSNAIRLAIANANADGGYQTIYSVREPVRLGQDVFTKGTISGHTIDRTRRVFLCRCGHSANKPFCDNSHKKIGFVA